MRDQLRRVFESALAAFLEEEASNIVNGSSEQNLCARLAMILERLAHAEGFTGYKADVEYNRNFGGGVKKIIDEHYQIVPIVCDIILHSRGSIVDRDNLIAIEMKRPSHKATEKHKDRVRLRAMTKPTYDDIWTPGLGRLPEYICGYELGYFLNVDKHNRSVRVEQFQDGNRTSAYRLSF